MRQLEQKKLLTLIMSRTLEKMVIEAVSKHSIGGYTSVNASGAGSRGIQSGMFDGDSNCIIYIILSEKRLSPVLEELDALLVRSYRIKVIVSDISILPRK